MTSLPPVPTGSNTVNPFIMAEDASGLIDFLIAVFEAVDVPEARTLDTDGLILHSELRVGDSLLTIADRKADWPFTPAFTRVYVHDAEATLARAEQRGGQIVTRPTDFFGDVLSRFRDPAGNLWWVYEHHPEAAQDWGSEESAEDWSADDSADEDWQSFTTPELEYIHSTLLEAMGSLTDPRTEP